MIYTDSDIIIQQSITIARTEFLLLPPIPVPAELHAFLLPLPILLLAEPAHPESALAAAAPAVPDSILLPVAEPEPVLPGVH